jgi:uncharacterized protein YceH (UPF0502 family)
MIHLTPEEARVLGVMVEKAHTVPGQYPITINGLISGCNQKNNREPVTSYDEERVLDALSALRQKGLAVTVDMAGSRVLKYKHNARETLGVGTAELVVLAEMLLRGPQTLGELRGRASRMHPLESLEVVEGVLRNLTERAEPLVQRIDSEPGGRAERYMQLLCPTSHPLAASPTPPRPAPVPSAAEPAGARLVELETKLVYQDRLLEELNAVVTRQQNQIDDLSRRVAAIHRQQLATQPGHDPADEPPPPHY